MLLLQIPTLADAYLAIATWAYRHYARQMQASGKKPTGIPGNRDPDSPCPAFEPRPRKLGDFTDCKSDGHYLCAECCHRLPAPQAREVEANELHLREELDLTDRLLENREQVLRAIPECPIHGPGCVPHAMEWIERAKAVQVES